MAYHKDRIGHAVSAGGTGALTLGSAVAKHQAFVAGDNARLFPYVIEDGDAWETGYGTYTHSGTSFARTTRTDSSTGSALDVTTAANVYVTWIANFGTQFEDVISTHISGLRVVWVSTTAVNIEIGAAYVQSVEKVIRVTATINLTSLSLGNSVWGYVYLKSDGTAECNTTAPAAAYAGTARSKTSDTSRRFLGAVKTNSSGNIIEFQHDPTSSLVMWRNESAGSFRVLSLGAATTKTAVSCAAGVPPTARVGFLRVLNNTAVGSGIVAYFGSNDDAISTTIFYTGMSANKELSISFPLDASQNAAYINSAVSGLAYIDILGYFNAR